MSCSSVTLRRCGATGCRGEQDSAAFLLASAAGDPVIGSLAPTHRRNHDQRNHSCSHPARTGLAGQTVVVIGGGAGIGLETARRSTTCW